MIFIQNSKFGFLMNGSFVEQEYIWQRRARAISSKTQFSESACLSQFDILRNCASTIFSRIWKTKRIFRSCIKDKDQVGTFVNKALTKTKTMTKTKTKTKTVQSRKHPQRSNTSSSS